MRIQRRNLCPFLLIKFRFNTIFLLPATVCVFSHPSRPRKLWAKISQIGFQQNEKFIYVPSQSLTLSSPVNRNEGRKKKAKVLDKKWRPLEFYWLCEWRPRPVEKAPSTTTSTHHYKCLRPWVCARDWSGSPDTKGSGSSCPRLRRPPGRTWSRAARECWQL